MRVESVCFLLRVHRRHVHLKRILRQMQQLSKDRLAYLVVRLDRPDPKVLTALYEGVEEAGFEDTLFIPATGATRGGVNWAHSCEELWEAARRFCDADVALLWDDDVVHTRKSLNELKRHLDFFVHDRIDGRWAMCYENEKQEDLNFPAHYAAVAFRVYPDDRWSLDRVQHAPAYVADSRKAVAMEAPLLHLGYLTDEDRSQAWDAAKATGKIDAHTLALTREPRLCPLD